MKKLWFVLLLVTAMAGKMYAQPADLIMQYIATYREAAIEEMKRTGVPAAITLAQGIHETDAGSSKLVLKSNNHFGIKCKSTWTGEWVKHDDDAPGECFRKYTSPLDSYKDHSDFLRSGARYAFLFDLDPTDYEGWCWGLKKAGYATNPKYPQVLIRIINEYNLQDYTLIAMGRKEMPKDLLANAVIPSVAETITEAIIAPPMINTYPTSVFHINNTKVTYITKGTSYLQVASEHRIDLRRLFDFNDMRPQDVAETDGLLFLQRKRKVGSNATHTVLQGETLHAIAQAEGIRLESLLQYNFLKDGMQPEVGEKLYLKSDAPAMPKLASATPAPITTPSLVLNSVSNNTATAATPAVVVAEAPAYIMHTVQPKETLYFISKKYSVAIDDVLRWNDLATTDLKAGQQLRINKKNTDVIN